MTDSEEPYTILYEMSGETFRKVVYAALLAMFKAEWQQHYHVTGFAIMPDDKVVIRLSRDMWPKHED